MAFGIEVRRQQALAAYPSSIAAGPWDFMSNAGGFSGAQLWRSPIWRLKAWPRQETDPQQLRQIHHWMRQAAAFEFVPRVVSSNGGDTLVDDGHWIWEIVAWMPGEPLLRSPTSQRLAAAGRTLATLHGIWRNCDARRGTSPAIARRMETIRQIPDLVTPAMLAESNLVRRLAPGCLAQLAPWRDVPLPLHPCLCDIWTDHVLFKNDAVSGLIDFGSARIEHPAADLARLLGDCLGGEKFQWQPLLHAYSAIHPLSPQDHALIAVLESTGAVAALATWIDRLKQRSPTPAESARVAKIVQRCTALLNPV